jgi:hypothetical protein
MTLDTEALFDETPANLGAAGPRRHRHVWVFAKPELLGEGPTALVLQRVVCARCGRFRDEVAARRGRNARNYGNRAELDVARKYGGTKVGHAGGPVDVRGAEFATQVKTHRRLPPLEWTKAFAAMAASSGIPRLLLRFLPGPGLPPDDYIVIPAKAWLEWFGKDGEDGA